MTLLLLGKRWLRQRRPRRAKAQPRRRRFAQLALPLRQQLALPGLGAAEEPEVLVHVVLEGQRARVLPVEGERLYIQFPRALRRPGAIYSVAALERVERPGRAPYLRARGPIRAAAPREESRAEALR